MSQKLKRFSDAKYAQVEQLISYSQLLGLNGTDLIAIGGKLERQAAKARKLENLKIIEGFVCLPVGRDHKNNINKRFKIEGAHSHYRFENRAYATLWTVINTKTKVRLDYVVDIHRYDLPSTDWFTKIRYAMLLDIASGSFKLDF